MKRVCSFNWAILSLDIGGVKKVINNSSLEVKFTTTQWKTNEIFIDTFWPTVCYTALPPRLNGGDSGVECIATGGLSIIWH